MFKKILTIGVLIVIIGLLVWGAVIRTQAKTGSENEASRQGNHGSEITTSETALLEDIGALETQGQGRQGESRGQGSTEINTEAHESATNLFASDPNGLSAEEIAALLYMREEEKLARDVYVTLYSLWGLPAFKNISSSEQVHMDSVKALLDHFGLSDPASSETGVFANPDLQALYTELVARGSLSLADAIKVGAAIEEIDILDLQERLTQTNYTDIQNVFNNLLSGSYNHLRAFVATLSNKTGETYQPQYLSPEVYKTILSETSGSSGGGGWHGGGNGNGAQP